VTARRVAVVVLGDLGRSPRMSYHALALAGDGAEVELVGYAGRPLDRAIVENGHIRTHYLRAPWRQRAPRGLYVAAALGDVVAQAIELLWLLAVRMPRLDVLLVQNPPALPTLLVAPLAARLSGARLIIDWHNFGFRMLGLRLGARHPLVRAAAAVEKVLGRRGDAHLCVSDAMRAELALRWGVGPTQVLRDRPPRRATRPTPGERQQLFCRLGLEAAERTAVVITSSSFSADEDFAPLLEAMALCDAAAGAPELLFVLTGDGPLRAHWEARIAALGLRRVRARTLWVAAEDYAVLLGAADLGLSLHRSASGLDLPMKISDMFGAGLPVCALDYGPVLGELVRRDENGVTFHTGAELAAHILALLAGYPIPTARLETLQAGVRRLAAKGWIDGWREEARAMFQVSP
jgi:beta-1,4-mannosyltransferase